MCITETFCFFICRRWKSIFRSCDTCKFPYKKETDVQNVWKAGENRYISTVKGFSEGILSFEISILNYHPVNNFLGLLLYWCETSLSRYKIWSQDKSVLKNTMHFKIKLKAASFVCIWICGIFSGCTWEKWLYFCNLLQCLCIFCKGSTSPRCRQCEANPQRTDEDKCHVAGQTSHFWTLFLVSNLSKSILVISHLHCCFSAEGKWNCSPTRSSTSWTRESSARCWEAQSHNWCHYRQSSDARSRQSLPSYCRGEKFGLLVFLYQ